jgi:hypothetical protein
MIEGSVASARAPFRYRVLVPLLARLLPFSPTASLRFISYLSLGTCYLLVLLTCSRMGISLTASLGGLFTAFASGFHLYYYHNPFLTDAFGLASLSLMVFCLVSGSFLLFAAAAIPGALARENVLFLAPVWAVRNGWRRSLILTGLVVMVLSVCRWVLRSDANPGEEIVRTFHAVGDSRNALALAREIFVTWGFTWFLVLLGIWLLPGDKFAVLATAGLALLVAGFLSSLIATDTGRMFSFLAPVVAVASAQLFAILISRGQAVWALILALLLVAQALLWRPNIVFGEESVIFADDRAKWVLLISGTAYSIWTAFILRDRLAREIRQKTAGMVEAARRLARA